MLWSMNMKVGQSPNVYWHLPANRFPHTGNENEKRSLQLASLQRTDADPGCGSRFRGTTRTILTKNKFKINDAKNGQETSVWVPGAIKLDHLQQINPTLLQKFSKIFTFILGGQFLLPQRGAGWKWENGNLPTWVRQRFFSAWGIQTGPFAAD